MGWAGWGCGAWRRKELYPGRITMAAVHGSPPGLLSVGILTLCSLMRNNAFSRTLYNLSDLYPPLNRSPPPSSAQRCHGSSGPAVFPELPRALHGCTGGGTESTVFKELFMRKWCIINYMHLLLKRDWWNVGLCRKVCHSFWDFEDTFAFLTFTFPHTTVGERGMVNKVNAKNTFRYLFLSNMIHIHIWENMFLKVRLTFTLHTKKRLCALHNQHSACDGYLIVLCYNLVFVDVCQETLAPPHLSLACEANCICLSREGCRYLLKGCNKSQWIW